MGLDAIDHGFYRIGFPVDAFVELLAEPMAAAVHTIIVTTSHRFKFQVAVLLLLLFVSIERYFTWLVLGEFKRVAYEEVPLVDELFVAWAD